MKREINRIYPIVVTLLFLHVVDRDHVAMRDEHEGGIIDHLGVELHEIGHPTVDHLVPGVNTFDFACVEADAIPPEMAHLSYFEVQLLDVCVFLRDQVRVFD